MSNARNSKSQVASGGKRKNDGRDHQKTKAAASQQVSAKKKADSKKIIMRVLAIVASLLLIFAFAFPSLATLITTTGGSSTNTSSSTTSSSSSSSSTATTMDYDSMLQSTVNNELAAISASPNDSSAYEQLANQYFDWASYVEDGTIESQYTVAELFAKAQEYYKKCLDNNAIYHDLTDYNAVTVDYAITLFYLGDTEGAIATLEAFNLVTGDFPYSWANLGLFYQNEGNTDRARECYQKALSTANSDTDSDLITQVQELLNNLG